MQLAGGNGNGLLGTAASVYRNEGLKAFYISFPVTLIMSIPFQAIQFTTYEYARKKLNPNGGYNPLTHCTAGAIAGAVASISTNPLDVAKTMLQTRGMASDNAFRHVSGLGSTFSLLYKKYGLLGFTKVLIILNKSLIMPFRGFKHECYQIYRQPPLLGQLMNS